MERAEEAENAKMLGGKAPEQFAERFHAAQHYKGGADQITPEDIGALPETTTPADIGAAPLYSALVITTGTRELTSADCNKTVSQLYFATFSNTGSYNIFCNVASHIRCRTVNF